MWIIWYFLLVVVSALFEGVLAAIMRLDKYELARRARLGSERAQTISPLRQRGRELALLFMLGSVLSGLGALAVATTHMQLWSALLLTTLLVVFSRLIARSALQGKGYKIARSSAPQLLQTLDIVAPVVVPLAGMLMKPSPRKSVNYYSKAELIEILGEHKEGPNTNLKQADVDIARSALKFADKTAQQIMSARGAITSISSGAMLNLDTLDTLHKSGHSRFPVTAGDSIDDGVGVLLLDQAVDAQSNSETVADLDLADLVFIPQESVLPEVLKMLREAPTQLGLVVDEGMVVKGLVTLSDVLNELVEAETS